MTTIELNELENCKELNAKEMSNVTGGLSFGLQQQLNQFQANLNAQGQILFNPYYQYHIITTSQQAWRRNYGRQMPWYFRTSF